MNFEFSDEQNLLREQAQSFLADKCPTDGGSSRARWRCNRTTPQLWRGMVDLGWTATSIPEEYGGIGLGYLELCVLAEELGRSLAPTPFSSSVYLATEALLAFGSAKQKARYLPKLAAGEWVGTFALAEGAGEPARSLKTKAKKARSRAPKCRCPDGDVADFAIVLAKEDKKHASMYIVDLNGAGVKREAVPTLDPTRSHASIRFNDAPASCSAKKARAGRRPKGCSIAPRCCFHSSRSAARRLR